MPRKSKNSTEEATPAADSGGLGRETKQEIKRWVLKLRHAFEDDFAQRLRRLGIEVGKTIGSAPSYLTVDEQSDREVIVAAINRDNANERSVDDAIQAYVRECSFTLLNRLVGLRCMEARGILFVDGEETEAITTRPEYQNRPRLLWTMREGSSRYRSDETLLWKDGLTTAFNAVTEDIGVLFDPDSEWSRLWPTQRVLIKAIGAINGLDATCGRTTDSSVFASPDFLGWVYQFFNVEEKEVIREATGGKPRTSHELAVINQFYTPDWIVKYLVDNTLGRAWLQMHPDTRLRDRISYLVPNTGEDARILIKPVQDLKLLDPACGTMHMGQYAFGLFYEMYLEEIDRAGDVGWADEPSANPTDIPSAILANNLHGIDIDPRAIQIAALTLMLTMKEQAKSHGLDPKQVHVQRMNLVCANAVDLGTEHMNEFIKGLDPAVFGGTEPLRRAVQTVWTSLKHVAELGSLIQVGEEVERALSLPISLRTRTCMPGQLPLDEQWGSTQLSLSEEDKTTARHQVETALADYIRHHLDSFDINTKLFALETEKAVGLLDLLRQKYDFVVMNPPYGAFVKNVNAYVRKTYPRTKNDIYAAFIERGAQLLSQSGYLGALTSRTFLNLGSFARLRGEILLKERPPVVVLDLGFNILDGAMVETCATVITSNATCSPRCSFIRLNKYEQDRLATLVSLVRGEHLDLRYDILLSEFRLLPTAPFSYWSSASLRQKFSDCAPLQPTVAEIKQGFATGDDDRFLRQTWEVEAHSVQKGRYVGFAKGGDYCKYYSDVDLVISWWQEGTLATVGNKLPSKAYYFRRGITYPRVTVKGFNVRLMPPNCIFADKGPAIFAANQSEEAFLLGWLNSALVQGFLLMLTPSRSFEVGHVQRLPILLPTEPRIGEMAMQIHDLKAGWDDGNEISTRFKKPWLVSSMARRPQWLTLDNLLTDCVEIETSSSAECQRLQNNIDAAVYDLYQISPEDRRLIERELGARPPETVWPQMGRKFVGQKQLEHICRLLSWLVKMIMDFEHDSIAPLIPCADKAALAERVRSGIEEVFGADQALRIEGEVVTVLGKRTSLESWLAKSYFKYHTALYKRRPIYWHITTDDGSFAAIVHYHRFNLDRLKKLRSVYLNDFIQRTQLEIGRLAKDNDTTSRARVAELEGNLQSARNLDDKLRMIEEGEFPIKVPWKSEADQPIGWRPDLDDGVKVNIAPFEAAGVLAVRKVT